MLFLKAMRVFQGPSRLNISIIPWSRSCLSLLIALQAHSGIFQRPCDLKCCSRLIAERDMRIQLSSIKWIVKEICSHVRPWYFSCCLLLSPDPRLTYFSREKYLQMSVRKQGLVLCYKWVKCFNASELTFFLSGVLLFCLCQDHTIELRSAETHHVAQAGLQPLSPSSSSLGYVSMLSFDLAISLASICSYNLTKDLRDSPQPFLRI